MDSRLATLSPSTEYLNYTLSTDRSKEFVRQEGLKKKRLNASMLPASAGKPSCYNWRKHCNRKSSHRQRVDISSGKQRQQIARNIWLPQFLPSGTSSSREAAKHLFSPWALCPSAVCCSFLRPWKEWDPWFWDNWILVILFQCCLTCSGSSAWVWTICVLILVHALWSPR